VIEKKLKKAYLRSARSRMQIGIGLFVSICLCGLLVIGLSSYNFSESSNVSKIAPPKKVLRENDTKKIREEFKKTLQLYETEIEPRLQAAQIERWNPDAIFEISELKKKVMLNFSNGDYRIAIDNLQLLKSLTEANLEEADHIFEENLGKATSFLAEGLYVEAKFHIEKALSIYSQSPEALMLQQEIERLPYILPLLDGAKVARAEHDLQKEYDYLQQVIRIAPEHEVVNDRLTVLAGLIKRQKFEAHMSEGFVGIKERQAKETRYHYQAARKIDSKRAELSVLLDQLLELEKSLRVQQAVKQAEEAVRRDDWQQVKINFARAAEDEPENKTVIEGLRRANHVLGLRERFSQYFKNPYRLARADVRNEAEQMLVLAQAASSYSFAIKRQAEQLSEFMTKVNRFIPVTVISDNETYISVRSIGKVGLVLKKIIQLKPGRYTFEGARSGFKSKLVQAFIPYDQNHFSVQVICHEPI